MFIFIEVAIISEPTRTDDGETASPFLRVKEKVVDDA